jgi:hypothetical protein
VEAAITPLDEIQEQLMMADITGADKDNLTQMVKLLQLALEYAFENLR